MAFVPWEREARRLGWWPCWLVKLDLLSGDGHARCAFSVGCQVVGMKEGRTSSGGRLISQWMHPSWKEMPMNIRNNDIPSLLPA